MEFYKNICSYYDDIFPLNPVTLEFLETRINKQKKKKKNCKVFDVACGSGNYTLELGKKGYSMIGGDLDKTMIDLCQLKVKVRQVKKIPRFVVSDMTQISREFVEDRNSFDGVFCIGNSLVHLSNMSKIKDSILGFYNLLKPKGTVIIQTINFERILADQVTSLPTISNDDKGVQFVRNYQYNQDEHKIMFETILTTPKNQSKQVVPLLPITSAELKDMLVEVGFKDLEFYGGFNGAVYNGKTSYAMIVVGVKG